MFSASARAVRPESRVVNEESAVRGPSFGGRAREPRSLRAAVCAISIACAFTVAAPARADEPTAGLAQSLFEAGRALMDEGKPELACPKFEESNRVDASAGTLLNLGKCFEALGRTASAQGH